jgi:hypothetical protein
VPSKYFPDEKSIEACMFKFAQVLKIPRVPIELKNVEFK